MRKPRILQIGAKYHVSAKINRGEHIFEPNGIKSLFLEIVKRAMEKYNFALKNFVIMDNHIHFIIEPLKNESLSKIMQWIFLSMDGLMSRVHGRTGATFVFAMRYNKIYNITGHVWQNRFWSKIIDDICQLFDTFKYISENPVKAEMVEKAEDYKYCGLYYILKGIYDIVDRPDFDYT